MTDREPVTFDMEAEVEAFQQAQLGWQSTQDADRPRDDAYFRDEIRYALQQLLIRGWHPPGWGRRRPVPAAGPYDTEQETYTQPMTASAHVLRDANLANPDYGRHVQAVHAAHLTSACTDAGVALGELDKRVLWWLATYENHTCEVLIGIIQRAYAAGREYGTD